MDYLKGVVIVAYPNEDATTDFEFKYWIDSYNSPPETLDELIDRIKVQNWKGVDGTKALVIAAVVASLGFCFLLCFLSCLTMCCKRFCCNSDENMVVII